MPALRKYLAFSRPKLGLLVHAYLYVASADSPYSYIAMHPLTMKLPRKKKEIKCQLRNLGKWVRTQAP